MSFLIRLINQQGFGRTRLGVCFQIQIILIIQIRVDHFGDSSSGLGHPRNPVKNLQRFLTTLSWSPVKNWASQVPVRGGVYSNGVVQPDPTWCFKACLCCTSHGPCVHRIFDHSTSLLQHPPSASLHAEGQTFASNSSCTATLSTNSGWGENGSGGALRRTWGHWWMRSST